MATYFLFTGHDLHAIVVIAFLGCILVRGTVDDHDKGFIGIGKVLGQGVEANYAAGVTICIAPVGSIQFVDLQEFAFKVFSVTINIQTTFCHTLWDGIVATIAFALELERLKKAPEKNIALSSPACFLDNHAQRKVIGIAVAIGLASLFIGILRFCIFQGLLV